MQKVIDSDAFCLLTAPGLLRNKADHTFKPVENIKSWKSTVSRVSVVPESERSTLELIMVGWYRSGLIITHVIYKPVLIHRLKVIIVRKSIVAARNYIEHWGAGVYDIVTHIEKRVIIGEPDCPKVRFCFIWNGSYAVKAIISESTPKTGSIPSWIYMLYKLIGICAHLLVVLYGILVGSYMYLFIYKYRIFTCYVFVKEPLDEINSIGVGYIQMVLVEHIFIRHNAVKTFWMCRSIYLCKDWNTVIAHSFLIIAIIVFGIKAVFCGQPGYIAFKPERTVIILSAVVYMQMHLIELEPCHVLCYFLDIFKRQVSTRHIDHSRANLVFGIILCSTLWNKSIGVQRL